MTVKSTDGYSSSYAVGSFDVSAVAVGDTVTVIGTVGESTVNLVSIPARA